MARKATAKWNGTLKEGDGTMRLGSGAWEGPYSFKSRFEEGSGSNPEELIGAALAACFSMQVAADIERAGLEPESVESEAAVELRPVDGTPTITKISLTTTANAPGADEAKVREVAENAKKNCIVSRALAGVETIELDLTVTT
jgi:osmotically inducible protein OsmC